MKAFLDRYWTQDAPPDRLALLRILIGLFGLHHVGSRFSRYTSIGETKATLFEPVGAVAFLDAPVPIDLWQLLLLATLSANALFIAGAFHRITGPVFATLLLVVMCYRNSWGMIYHTDNLLVLHTIVLGVSRSADALSVDSLIRRQRGNRTMGTSIDYGWPVQLICAVTVTTYFLSGVAKIAGPLGWGWAQGEAFRSQIAMDGLRKELLGKPAPKLAFILYDQVAVFTSLGVLTLILELGAPLALLGKRAGYVFAALAYGLHCGILFLMDIKFPYQLWGVAYLSFFPLERIMDTARKAFLVLGAKLKHSLEFARS